VITYQNPYPVAFPYEKYLPLPGTGFTPNLAGPARLGVGEIGPYDDLMIYLVAVMGLLSLFGYQATKHVAELAGQKKSSARTWGLVGAAALPAALALWSEHNRIAGGKS